MRPDLTKRNFLKTMGALSATGLLSGCSNLTPSDYIMTVKGPLSISQMGWTLPHEHLFIDMRPRSQRQNPSTAETYEEAEDVLLPYVNQIKNLGVKTLVETTATGFGRAPELIKTISQKTGVNIIMPTGLYLTADQAYVPDYGLNDTAENIAARWIEEFELGIRGTGIRPGMIKLGFDGGNLSELDKKIIKASAIAHLKTGLVIGVHIGPWRAVEPGFLGQGAENIIKEIQSFGVSPEALIWIHAQNEVDYSYVLKAAEKGVFISLDSYRRGQEDVYTNLVTELKESQFLSNIHLSQDAGWYSAGENRGGAFSPYDPIMTTLIPHLLENEITEDDLNTIFVKNPAKAFQVKVRP